MSTSQTTTVPAVPTDAPPDGAAPLASGAIVGQRPAGRPGPVGCHAAVAVATVVDPRDAR
jgi:hypothetical protein